MKKKSNIYLLILTLITVHITAIPIGEVVVIDIPWILDANDDCSILVGGGGGGGQYWTEDTGIITISTTGACSAISGNGLIAGIEVEEDEATACWWDIDILEPNFLGSIQVDQTNTANTINNDGSVIAGLQWYSGGMGTAKAYKWTPESGSVLLPDVMDWSDSRADCCTADGSLIGGYAAQERSIWRPVLWDETDLIELPYVVDSWSTVSSISPNGEWCSGYNGSDGIIWHNQEIAGYETEGPEFIQLHFRTITDDGWAGGENANWNTQVAYPILWNPVDSLMNAIEFFEANGVTIPDDYELFRIRRISNDHLTYICNGVDLNTSLYKSSILKILGPHSVSNFNAETEEYNDVHLTWDFDENTPSAENIIIQRDGVEITQLSPSVTEYFDSNLSGGIHQYEIYVTYNVYDNSISRFADVEIILNTPTNLAAEVIDYDVQLSWDQPLAPRNFSGYKIYRDEEEIAFVTETSFLDSGLETGTYNYYVTAIFSDLYESEPSNEVEAIVETGSSIEENEITNIDRLIGNYPNPFNPETTISFNIKETKKVVLEVYNTKGQKIRMLVNNNLPAGNHKVVWNGTDENNLQVSSGIYFYKLRSTGFEQIKKMILIK